MSHAAPALARPAKPPPRVALSALVRILLCAMLLLGVLLLSPSPGTTAGTPGRSEQLRFMWAMAGQESGWDYYARNAWSGAFGKYQIMPFNWPVWAAQYLGDRRADQTPWNQERVAFGKLRDLYGWLGSWKRVAYWWLTGSDERNEKRWSSYARGYVRNIMRLRHRAPAEGAAVPARTGSGSRPGDWRRSASRQRLRLDAQGPAWSREGVVRDGEVIRVRESTMVRRGVRWIRVVTADGRLGWLRQLSTVPARRPEGARRWRDVDDRGHGGRSMQRRLVHPRPR